MQTRSVFAYALVAMMITALVPESFGDDKENDQTTVKKSKTLDVSFIPSDSFVVVYVHPARILKHERASAEASKPALAMIQAAVGIDPSKIDQIVLSWGLQPDGRPDDDEVIVVLRTTEPADTQSLRNSMRVDTETKINDKAYYTRSNRGPHGPTLHIADERTLLITRQSRMEKLLKADTAPMSDLITRLKTLDGDHDALLLMNVAAIREKLLRDIERDCSPGPHKAFGPGILNNTKSIFVTARLTDDEPIKAVFESADAEKADEKLTAAAKQILTFCNGWETQREKALANADRFPLAKTAVETIDKVLKDTEIKQDGKRVLVTLKSKGGMPVLADVLLGTVFGRAVSDSPPPDVPRTVPPPSIGR